MSVTAQEITEALLAILVVGGVVGIATFDAINGKPVNIPPELYGFGGIIIGAYFRGNTINGAVARLTEALNPAPIVTPK